MYYGSIEPSTVLCPLCAQYLQIESNRPELPEILCVVPSLSQYCMSPTSQVVRIIRKSSSHKIVVHRPR